MQSASDLEPPDENGYSWLLGFYSEHVCPMTV